MVDLHMLDGRLALLDQSLRYLNPLNASFDPIHQI